MTMPAIDYAAFLDRKAQLGTYDGFSPRALPSFLFDFQAALVEWALRKGRSAIFADCGLGKSPMQLVWAQQVVEHTNRPVLILTPLAVAAQTVREAEKFGIAAVRSADGRIPSDARIVVANYERLHFFDWQQFAGVVCDESSILKAFDGVRRAAITEFMRKLPFRLLCTATAAPNDYIELGTSSEALGELGFVDMLGRFFKNDQGSIGMRSSYAAGGEMQAKWRFKGHAEVPFWRWVASWARALRRPSDLGFDDARFQLPPLQEVEHCVADLESAGDTLFAMPAIGLKEQRADLRRTLRVRCERAAELVADTGAPAICWCHLNAEADLLERSIPDAVQVTGSEDDDVKEAKFLAFTRGETRVLVTKPSIGALGLNFQHCAHLTVFPSHSFEQYYQAVRRCWRFGQTRPVRVDIITTEGQQGVKSNLQRKAAQADRMFDALTAHMRNALHLDRERGHGAPEAVPSWL